MLGGTYLRPQPYVEMEDTSTPYVLSLGPDESMAVYLQGGRWDVHSQEPVLVREHSSAYRPLL
jgi:hypothetical protein